MESQQVVLCSDNPECEKWYYAPEHFKSPKASLAGDVWSVCCVNAEMFTQSPLLQLQLSQSSAFPLEKQLDIASLLPDTMPEDLKDLLKSGLQYNTDDRCTAIDAMFHPYFTHVFTQTIKINGTPVLGLTDFNMLEEACYEDRIEKANKMKSKKTLN